MKSEERERIVRKFKNLKNRVKYRNKKYGWNIRVEFSEDDFLAWYDQREKRCSYCEIPEHLIWEIYWAERKTARPDTRKYLEVDRKYPCGDYTENNCVLACFVCNNAKSDIFKYEEFVKMGKIIEVTWRQIDKHRLKKIRKSGL